jgi:hypothetical protein
VLGNEVIFDVDKFALCVNPLEGVAAIAVVEAPAYRGTVIAEEHETSVVAFRGVAQQVKDRVVVKQEVLGVAPLGTDDVGTLDGVATEEDGLRRLDMPMIIGATAYKVQAYDVVVALHGVELDSKTTWVTRLISILSSGRDSRETNEDGGLFAYARQKVGFLVSLAVVSQC